jgi:hypothetical protein
VRLPLPTMCQEQIDSLRSPTMAPVSLMAFVQPKTGLGPGVVKALANSLMLKWRH